MGTGGPGKTKHWEPVTRSSDNKAHKQRSRPDRRLNILTKPVAQPGPQVYVVPNAPPRTYCCGLSTGGLVALIIGIIIAVKVLVIIIWVCVAGSAVNDINIS